METCVETCRLFEGQKLIATQNLMIKYPVAVGVGHSGLLLAGSRVVLKYVTRRGDVFVELVSGEAFLETHEGELVRRPGEVFALAEGHIALAPWDWGVATSVWLTEEQS